LFVFRKKRTKETSTKGTILIDKTKKEKTNKRNQYERNNIDRQSEKGKKTKRNQMLS
jgi:hypothetical protein